MEIGRGNIPIELDWPALGVGITCTPVESMSGIQSGSLTRKEVKGDSTAEIPLLASSIVGGHIMEKLAPATTSHDCNASAISE